MIRVDSMRKYFVGATLVLGMGLLCLSGGRLFVCSFVTSEKPSSDPETTIRVLESLPYVGTVTETHESQRLRDVVSFNRLKAYAGWNLYCNHTKPDGTRFTKDMSGAFLLDMEGKLVHRWLFNESPNAIWEHVKAYPDGSVVAILPEHVNPGLVKLAWDSNLVFAVSGRFHHDFDIGHNGTIYALTTKPQVARLDDGCELHIELFNYLTVISREGDIVKEIELFELFKNLPATKSALDIARNAKQRSIDLFHANTVEVISKSIDGFAHRGDVLLCLRNLNVVVVLDVEKEKPLWIWGEDELDYPHHPSLLENGNLLIFDNGYFRGNSRIIELDTRTRAIVWSYQGDKDNKFFSRERGGCQRLPNGNTLITESNKGRVFEVNSKGETVWEWYNPHFIQHVSPQESGSDRANKEHRKRKVLYRMMRLPLDYFDPGLDFNDGNVLTALSPASNHRKDLASSPD